MATPELLRQHETPSWCGLDNNYLQVRKEASSFHPTPDFTKVKLSVPVRSSHNLCRLERQSATVIESVRDKRMVLKQNIKRIVTGRSKPRGGPTEQRGFSYSITKRRKSMNQLFHPISPYDELPEIQDLVDKLVPVPKPSQRKAQEVSQERQQQNQKQKRSSDDLPQRDPPTSSPQVVADIYLNGAHDVPSMIEIPSIPTQSQDSDLTLDEIFRPKAKSEDGGPRTLTPHPSFEEVNPTASDLKYLFEAGLKADQEVWPSDEESVPKGRKKVRKENKFWSDGAIHVWDLDCRDGKDKHARSSGQNKSHSRHVSTTRILL